MTGPKERERRRVRVPVDESAFEEGRHDGASPTPTEAYVRPKVEKPSRPYQDEAWLRQELARLGTYRAVAREHGFYSNAVSVAGRSFGIDVQREYGLRSQPFWDEKWLRAELQIHGTFAAVAREHGFDQLQVQRAARTLGLSSLSKDHAKNPYRDEAWLRAELQKHGTYSAVAREHGFNPITVGAAGKSFGIDVQREYGTRSEPYWDEEWLRHELARLGGYKAVALEYGFKHWLVAAAGRSFGIDVRREYGARAEPYWSEEWLRAELRKHGSYSAVAREHGFVLRRLRHAGKSLGIALRKKKEKPKGFDEKWLREQLAELGSYKAVAEKYRLDSAWVAAVGRSFGIDVRREYGERSRPYWNEAWLRAELEKHGTYGAVAREHGFDNFRVSVAGRSFGIDVRREYGATERDKQLPYWDAVWLREQLGAHATLLEVARQHGFVHSRVLVAARELGVTTKAEAQRRRTPPANLGEAWLRAELEQQPLVSRVAALHGMPVKVVAAAVRKYKIDVQSEYWAKRKS